MGKEESIGSLLKKARLKKGLTLEDAYKDLKIQPKMLDSLEKDGDLAISKIYVKSFIKKYAKYLNVDIAKTPAFSPPPSTPASISAQPIERETAAPLFTKDKIKRYILIFVTAVTFSFFVFIVTPAALRTIKKPKKTPPPPTPAVSQKQPSAVVATKREEPPKPKSFLPIPKDQPLSLKVEAKDKVWMRVKSDGKIIFEHTLKKGSVESWSAKKDIELWVGKAEALSLSLNGNPLASPGSGRIKRIVINHNGLTVAEK